MTHKTEAKYPDAGCRRGYFVDTASVQVARGCVALFAGFTREDGSPDRTSSARLICAADSIVQLKAAHPEAFSA